MQKDGKAVTGLLSVPKIGSHRNSDERKDRELLLTLPISDEKKSSDKY